MPSELAAVEQGGSLRLKRVFADNCEVNALLLVPQNWDKVLLGAGHRNSGQTKCAGADMVPSACEETLAL
jgi:hypothetical protein